MSRPKGSKNKSTEAIKLSDLDPGPQVEASSLVRPLIRVEGKKHPFETLEKTGELPLLTSVGMIKASPNSRDFISYTIKSKGNVVLSIEVSEPDNRIIAEDSTKTAFVDNFMNTEEGAL